MVFCHGSPRNDDEVVLVDTRLDRWAEVLADLPEQVRTVVCGHTHMPFVRLAHGRQIINPGSVGMPYGRPGAHWSLLANGVVSVQRTLFDIDAAMAALRAAVTYPDIGEWADFYLNARGTDAEAIAVFGPRDGR